MCSGREFQVDGAEMEKAHEEKLLVMAYGPAKPLRGVVTT